MTSTVQLVWSLVASAIGMVIACSLALWLIPQLSLEATIRGGTIAFLSMAGVRCAMWVRLRQKPRGRDVPDPPRS